MGYPSRWAAMTRKGLMMETTQIQELQGQLAQALEDADVVAIESLLSGLDAQGAKTVLNTQVGKVPLPIIRALLNQNPQIVDIYVKHGADLGGTDFRGNSALDYIFDICESEVDEQIRNAFADILETSLDTLPNSDSRLYINKISPLVFKLLQADKDRFMQQSLSLQSVKMQQDRFTKLLERSKPQLRLLAANGGYDLLKYQSKLKRFSHVLGLKSKTKLSFKQYQIDLQGEGNTLRSSKALLFEMVRDYVKNPDLEPTVKNNFDNILNAMADKPNAVNIKYVECGWPGHAVGVAIVGDKLALCNRGDRYSELSGGVKIFNLKSENNAVFLNDLKRQSKSSKEFEAQLGKLVDLQNPTHEFKQIKDQNHGTCSFVNQKSLIVAMLHLQGDQQAYEHYKQFTAWLRDREIDKTIKNLHKATIDKNYADEIFYLNLLQRYAVSKIHRKDKMSVLAASNFEQRLAKIQAAFDNYESGKKYNEIISSHQSDPKELKTALKKVFVRDINLSNPTSQSSITNQQPENLGLWGRFVRFVKNLWQKFAALFSSSTPQANLQFDDTKIKGEDSELKTSIVKSFKLRHQALQQKIASAASSRSKVHDENSIRLELLSLEMDWQAFTKATTTEQLLRLSDEYVEKREPVCFKSNRKNLWIVSRIFSKPNEADAIDNMRSILASRKNVI
jgi:hypothetical protein